MAKDLQYHDVSRLGKPLEERRASRRLLSSDFPDVKGTSIVAGPKVQVENVSRRGILFSSDVPLSPGMRVHLRLVASGVKPIILKGVILRSRLETLQVGQPIYYSAVAIDQDFPFLVQDEVEVNAEEEIWMAVGCPTDGGHAADISADGEEQMILTLKVEVPENSPDIS
jgi:hypothetical protein